MLLVQRRPYGIPFGFLCVQYNGQQKATDQSVASVRSGRAGQNAQLALIDAEWFKKLVR